MSDRLLSLDPSEWRREDEEARAWLEEKLGRPLPRADEASKRTQRLPGDEGVSTNANEKAQDAHPTSPVDFDHSPITLA